MDADARADATDAGARAALGLSREPRTSTSRTRRRASRRRPIRSAGLFGGRTRPRPRSRRRTAASSRRRARRRESRLGVLLGDARRSARAARVGARASRAWRRRPRARGGRPSALAERFLRAARRAAPQARARVRVGRRRGEPRPPDRNRRARREPDESPKVLVYHRSNRASDRSSLERSRLASALVATRSSRHSAARR